LFTDIPSNWLGRQFRRAVKHRQHFVSCKQGNKELEIVPVALFVANATTDNDANAKKPEVTSHFIKILTKKN
jgi:hypothetical protein